MGVPCRPRRYPGRRRAGHWASGRRRRALAAWASAAGFGLVAWGLCTEAPARAELDNLLRELGVQAPAAGVRMHPRPAGDRGTPGKTLLPLWRG